ncbi:MAG TPA: hypothetical protein VL360_08415 [Gammaproteobacteria bacterium]|nr:hypothetical protein [Gammaproteobacteria bacterium]
MKIYPIITFIACIMLSSCESTTTQPDINSLQPSPQEQHQQKIQQALQS